MTDNVKQEKGYKAPDAWKPPSVSYWCTYARIWIAVKHDWELTVTDRENEALTSTLARVHCIKNHTNKTSFITSQRL